MHVALLTIEGCPNETVAEDRLVEALRRLGLDDQVVDYVVVTTDEEARAARFRGSPTIRIDGEDPFEGDAEGPYGVTCRVYPTPDGLAGAPTVEQIVTALADRR